MTMRALGVDSDVIVFDQPSGRRPAPRCAPRDEGFVIDSPIYPEELRALPDVLEQAGFPVSGLLATHGDWDHLLGRLAFPEASLGCGESTAERLAAEPGDAAAQAAARSTPSTTSTTAAAGAGRRPVAAGARATRSAREGRRRELELHEAAGHTADGTAYWIPWLGVLVCGDYLSPVEIPWISRDGSVDAYLATLERLRPSVGAGARRSSPVTAGRCEGRARHAVLDEDVAYLDALRLDGLDAPLPAGRRTDTQRRIHAENVQHRASNAGATCIYATAA